MEKEQWPTITATKCLAAQKDSSSGSQDANPS